MEKVNFMQKDGLLSTETHILGNLYLLTLTHIMTKWTLYNKQSHKLFSDLYTSSALFLRQAGLWEQLIMLMRLNLQLNLTQNDTEGYKVTVNLPEQKISMFLFFFF